MLYVNALYLLHVVQISSSKSVLWMGIVFNVDPDQNFHFDADPDLDPDRHQNDVDPHADRPQLLHMLKNQKSCFYF